MCTSPGVIGGGVGWGIQKHCMGAASSRVFRMSYLLYHAALVRGLGGTLQTCTIPGPGGWTGSQFPVNGFRIVLPHQCALPALHKNGGADELQRRSL